MQKKNPVEKPCKIPRPPTPRRHHLLQEKCSASPVKSARSRCLVRFLTWDGRQTNKMFTTRWAPTIVIHGFITPISRVITCYNWVTGVITLLIGVITPLITGRGPSCTPPPFQNEVLEVPRFRGYFFRKMMFRCSFRGGVFQVALNNFLGSTRCGCLWCPSYSKRTLGWTAREEW